MREYKIVLFAFENDAWRYRSTMFATKLCTENLRLIMADHLRDSLDYNTVERYKFKIYQCYSNEKHNIHCQLPYTEYLIKSE